MTYQNKKVCYFISIVLHLTLLFAFTPSKTAVGDKQNKIVKSYLYQESLSQLTAIHATKIKSSAVKNVKQKEVMAMAAKAKPDKQVTQSVDKSSQQSLAKSSSHGQQIEALLVLLHDAIQKQQHYPPTAMEMERQGRVTVTFILSPNGSIHDLQVIKSSGTQSLDNAAIAAVNAAAPFSQIDHYLDVPREFNLDVVFELT